MKKKYILILLLMFFIGISDVSAMTLKPTGDSTGKRGEEITLYVTLNKTDSEKSISAVDGTFSYDTNALTLVSSSDLMTDWTKLSSISNNGVFSYANLTFNNLITKNSQDIAKVVLKVNDGAAFGNTTVSISNPSATDENGDGVTISGGNHAVKVLSDVNTLSNITVSGGTLNFSENTTEYNLTLDSTSTTIGVTKKDSSSTVSGDGNKTLNYGLNTFKITVTSESGKNKVYTINITRPDNRSKVNTLSSLSVSEGKINFNKDTLNYNLTVENDITSIKVDASLTDSTSSFVNGYGPRTLNLIVGNNIVEIKVKAENEEIKTYTLNITRKEAIKEEEITDEENEEKDNPLKKIYNVKFNLDGGSLYKDGSKVSNNTFELSNLNYSDYDAKKDGHSFSGWSTNKSCLNASKNKVIDELTNDTELWACYTKNNSTSNKVDNEIDKNQQTGSWILYVVCLIGILALGYSCYYLYKYLKTKKEI